jgi:hypothetical protein
VYFRTHQALLPSSEVPRLARADYNQATQATQVC